jgi:alginate O-acetyltransferase complex protein AlgI
MTVPSFQFLALVVAGALVYNISSALHWRQAVLLAINILFLATLSRSPAPFLPFAGFLVLGFVSVRVLQAVRSSKLFVAAICCALLSFFWLKKYAFLPEESFLQFPYVTIGLSYVFFRVMHLMIDAHQNSVESSVRAIDYANYTLNFTSLVSGPIQRFQDYHRMQNSVLPALDEVIVGRAVERIALGFFKVFVVSMLLLHWHTILLSGFGSELTWGARTVTGALIVAIYPIYLYFNFAGYTDTVIGAARLFRLELPENFNRPFSSENFITFWSHWHITLSNWLKTYVYNPLLMALMRRFESPRLEPYFAALAFFVTFFLVGAWHGQTSEFLFFGVLQGAGVAINKLYQIEMARSLGRKRYRALCQNAYYRALSRGFTPAWFAATLLWFWSDWSQIAALWRALGAAGAVGAAILTTICATVGLWAWVAIRDRVDHLTIFSSRYVRTAAVSAEMAVLVMLNVVLESPAPEIVYKGF